MHLAHAVLRVGDEKYHPKQEDTAWQGGVPGQAIIAWRKERTAPLWCECSLTVDTNTVVGREKNHQTLLLELKQRVFKRKFLKYEMYNLALQ